MIKFKNRLLALLLAVAMVFTVIPAVSVFADSPVDLIHDTNGIVKPGVYVTNFGGEYSSSYPLSKVIDNTTDGDWVPNPNITKTAPAWVQVNFPAAHIVTEVSVVGVNSKWERTAFSVRASNDVDFTESVLIGEIAENYSYDAGEVLTFPFSDGNSYKYVRIAPTKTNSLGVREIDIKGYEATLDVPSDVLLTERTDVVASTSAEAYSDSFTPLHALDGNNSTASVSMLTPYPIFDIDLRREVEISQIRWMPRNNSGAAAGIRKNFEVYVSATGAFGGEEKLVYRRFDNTAPMDAENYTIVSDGVPYRYVRFKSTNSTNISFDVSEIEIYGTEISSSQVTNLASTATVTASSGANSTATNDGYISNLWKSTAGSTNADITYNFGSTPSATTSIMLFPIYEKVNGVENTEIRKNFNIYGSVDGSFLDKELIASVGDEAIKRGHYKVFDIEPKVYKAIKIEKTGTSTPADMSGLGFREVKILSDSSKTDVYVEDYTPANNTNTDIVKADDVTTNYIEIEFNKAPDIETITPDTVKILNNGTPVDWKTGVDDAVIVEGNLAKISMKALAVNKAYIVEIPVGGVKTVNGLPLTEQKTFSFTTNVNIAVTQTFPANGGNVDVVNEDDSFNAVEVTFNKNLEETTVIPANITITDVTNGVNNVVSTWEADVSDNKFSISTEYLTANKDYTLVITDRVKTKRNLSLTTTPYTLSFGTHVVVEMQSTEPANGQNVEYTNVDGTYNFVKATFNKNINPATVNSVNVEIKNVTDNIVVTEWEPVVDGKDIKISTEYLAPNKSYTITFEQGGIKTMQGMPLTETETIAFTTNVDVSVVSKTPNGVTGVTNIGNDNPFIEVELNRAPDALSLTPDNVKIKTGSTEVTGWTATVSGNKFLIDLSHLKSNKSYTVTLTRGITAGGCPLTQADSFSFSTGTIIAAPHKDGKVITNIALNKPVSGNLDSAYSSRIPHIVDGAVGAGNYAVTTTSGVRIQLDLQNVYDVAAVELYPSEQSVHSTLLQNAAVLGSKTDLDINNMSIEKASSLTLGSYPAGTTGSQMITLQTPKAMRYVGLFRATTYCAISELKVYAYVDKDFGAWKVTKGEDTMTEVSGSGTYTFSLPVTNYEKDADSDYYMIISAYDENSKMLYKSTGNVTALKNETSTLSKSIDIDDVSNVAMITAALVKSTTDGASFVDAKSIYKTSPDLPNATEIPTQPAQTFKDAIKFSVENDGFKISAKAYENGYIKPTDRINVQVLEPKSDKTGYDFATISTSDYVSKLCYAKTCGMFADGEDFEFKFKVKDPSKYGEYSIKLTLTKEDGAQETLNEYIVYLSDDDALSCVTAFKNFTEADNMESLLNTWVTTKKYISASQLYQGLNITDVPDSFNKMFEYLCDMYVQQGSMTKIQDVADCLNGAYIISMFEESNATNATSALTAYPAVLKGMYDNDADVSKFITVYTDLKSNIQDAQSLEKVIRWSSALSYIQNGTRRDISDTIEKNHTLMGCDLNYADSNGVTVDDVALKLVTNTGRASGYYDVFGQIFKDKVDEIVAGRTSPGGSSPSPGVIGGTYVPNKAPTVSPDVPKGDENIQTPDEPKNEYSFSDIANITWANEHIEALYKKGIINGAGDGKFYPERLVSREEFLKMVIEALEIGISDGLVTEFEDCKSNAWYYPYVQIASSNKITNGIDRKNFGIGLSITREDMAVLISKSLTIKGIVGKKSEYVFKDENSISKYAQDAVNKMNSLGLINGFEDGSFGPKQGTTRAQAAVIIGRMLELLKEVTK